MAVWRYEMNSNDELGRAQEALEVFMVGFSAADKVRPCYEQSLKLIEKITGRKPTEAERSRLNLLLVSTLMLQEKYELSIDLGVLLTLVGEAFAKTCYYEYDDGEVVS